MPLRRAIYPYLHRVVFRELAIHPVTAVTIVLLSEVVWILLRVNGEIGADEARVVAKLRSYVTVCRRLQ